MRPAMIDGLFLPILTLAFLGWLVPKLWALALPEGGKALALNAVLSALTLGLVTAIYFIWAYLRAGVSLHSLSATGLSGLLVHFGSLGFSAAIIWAPFAGLSLMGLPRHWSQPW